MLNTCHVETKTSHIVRSMCTGRIVDCVISLASIDASSAAISATPHRGRVKHRAERGPPTHPNESITALYRQLRDSQLSAVEESHFHASTHSEIARATAGSNGASSSRPCGTVKHNQGGVDHFGRSNGRQCSPRRPFAPQPTGARPPARCRRAGLRDARRQATQRSTLN